jgi:hypothetical protein
MVELRHNRHLRGGTMPASSDDSGASESGATESGANEDLKAKMREALDRKKQGGAKGLHGENPLREKAHGSEVTGGAAPKMHRRKAGGGGS